MPRLTEQERQEVIRYIEADKPLPDKFRFLLFEEKREVVRATVKYDFVYVDQESFEQYHPVSFVQLVDGFKEYK